MVKIHDEPDCGNAPRREILKDFVVALAERNLEKVTSLLDDEVAWTLIGDRTLTGPDAVQEWVAALPEVDEVVFGSVLTHGRGASVDGVFHLVNGTKCAFCHVLSFAGAAKTSKIVSVNSYAIILSAES